MTYPLNGMNKILRSAQDDNGETQQRTDIPQRASRGGIMRPVGK